MKNRIPLLPAIFFLALYSSSCIKSHNDQAPPQVMTWQINGGPNQSADTISFIRLLGVSVISANKGTTRMFLSTMATTPGSYSTLAATVSFGLTIAGVQYGTISGGLTITSNANFRLSGNFNAVFNDNNNGTISFSGSFSDISYY